MEQLSVIINFIVISLSLIGSSLTETFECKQYAGLNTDHQFHCCYTSRSQICSNLCIDNDKVCDGTPDCPDARDEWSSLCDNTCTLGYQGFKGFSCQRTWKRCLAFNSLCDEEVDCISEQVKDDKSDEDHCDCFSNKDCPFFRNETIRLPPTESPPTPTLTTESDGGVFIIVLIITLAVVVLIIGALAIFFFKKYKESQVQHQPQPHRHPQRSSLLQNPLTAPSAPSPSSSSHRSNPSHHIGSSPSHGSHPSLANGHDTSGRPIGAPPAYEEIDKTSPSRVAI